MNNWPYRPLSAFLIEREGRFKPNDPKIASYKRLDKIDFSGKIHISEKPSKTDMIIIEPGDLVISGINVAKGALAVYDGDEPVTATIHYSSYRFNKNKIDIEFLKRFLKSPAFISELQNQVKGGIKTEIKPKHLLPLKARIPELAEQQKINQYFDAIDNEVTDLSNEVNTQSSYITKLRQAILQEAIEGKLTADWRKENPARKGDPDFDAEALLEKIQAEKEKLIKKGKIKKQKPLAPIKAEEVPFELPEGWVWTRLGEVTELITKGSSPNWQGVPYVEKGKGIRFITSKNVGFYKIDFTDETFVDERFNQIEPRSVLKNGDILTNIVGASIGRTAIYDLDDNANINQAVCILRYTHKYVIKLFFLHWMNSPIVINKMHEDEFAPGRANLSMLNVASFLFALPPLAEQQAIVDRVEKLLSMVDELEKQVSERKEQSEQLMQAVLREAFEGGK